MGERGRGELPAEEDEGQLEQGEQEEIVAGLRSYAEGI